MSVPVLYLALPCRKCGAAADVPCVRRDGLPAYRPHVGRTPPAPCGSYGGVTRHAKEGTPLCEPCKEARRRYISEYRNRNPEYRDKDIALLRARREATRLLIEAHREDFDRLMDGLRP